MTPDAEQLATRYLAAAQAGDAIAYDALLRLLAEAARVFVGRRIAWADWGEDVVQDILLTVHRVRQTYDPARPFGPWFYAIASARLIDALAPLEPAFNGDPERTLPHVVNVALPGLDSEAVMVALKGLVALSNGSACTSHSYEPSHVLEAMDVPEEAIRGALRISWCHLTEDVDWSEVMRTIETLR